MKTYKFTALNAEGKVITSLTAASSKDEAAAKIKSGGFKLIELKRSFFSGTKVKADDIISFFSRLALLLKARVNLLKALKLTSKNSNNILKEAVNNIIKDIQEGLPFSAAIKKIPFFTKMQSALIEIGEKTARLDKVIIEIARIEKEKRDFESNIKLLLIYPLIVLSAAGLALIFLFLFVLPKLKPVFADFNVSLPLSTRLLFFTADLLTNHLTLMVITALVFIFAAKKILKSGDVQKKIYKYAAKTKFYKYYLFGVYFTNLSLCISSGFNPVESITVSNKTISNPYVLSKMNLIYLKAKQGQALSVCFENDPYFNDLNIEAALSGEETSSLSESFLIAAEDLKERAFLLTKKFIAVFEPAVIAFTGIIVGLIAASVLIPLFELTSSVS